MTDLTFLQQKISSLLPDIKTLFQEPLSKHTSFRIGGPAEVMVFPRSRGELAKVLEMSALLDCSKCILGAGTNILAPDEGVKGLVICLKDSLNGIQRISENQIRVMAGVTMSRAAVFAANLGLSGLEFAHGIPGSVGGGVYMNAGAYGGEISQVCTQVEVMESNGSLHVLSNREMEFSYRHSILEDRDCIVISADFQLTDKPKEQIFERMQELIAKRKASQPLDMPSAGSAFKRPVGGYAAAMIDEAGLKGYQIGGAAISTKHAGFAVNMGGATAGDVKALLKSVSDIVFERTGTRLEPEVRIW